MNAKATPAAGVGLSGDSVAHRVPVATVDLANDDPHTIDAWVRERITAGAGDEVSQRLHVFNVRGYVWDDPARDAVLALAYARMVAARQPSASAAAWFAQAEQFARDAGTTLSEVFDTADLEALLAQVPRVVDGHFSTGSAMPGQLATRTWVVCGRCGAPGVVRSSLALAGWASWPGLPRQASFRCTHCTFRVSDEVPVPQYGARLVASPPGARFGNARITGRARCTSCGTMHEVDATLTLSGTPVTVRREACRGCGSSVDVPVTASLPRGLHDPYYGMDLYLTVDTTDGVLFAYNGYHLALLRAYVAATHRSKSTNNNYAWTSRLPAWITAAKNRDKVLRALGKLDALAEGAGLPRDPLHTWRA
jgi:NAD-dependent dihydropyrimidine dehydrogenase PreA subunit